MDARARSLLANEVRRRVKFERPYLVAKSRGVEFAFLESIQN
jgi:hypothetical protein